jgi:hypothetical protein
MVGLWSSLQTLTPYLGANGKSGQQSQQTQPNFSITYDDAEIGAGAVIVIEAGIEKLESVVVAD